MNSKEEEWNAGAEEIDLVDREEEIEVTKERQEPHQEGCQEKGLKMIKEL